MKRVLAFFGAFNPPTLAHVNIAETAMRQSGAQGVIFVPSKSSYIQNEQRKDFAFSDEQRLGFLKALSQSRKWLSYTDIEINSPSQPRTYETLCRLRASGYEPRLLLGSDNLADMGNRWRYVEEMLTEFGVVCAARGGDDCEEIIARNPRLSAYRHAILIVTAPETLRHVSSSLVREKLGQMLALRRELSSLVPGEVLNEIQYTYADNKSKGEEK